MITWRDLKDDPPTGEEYCVLLFPCRTDCGLFYITSNPHYAKLNGIKNGFTHWAEFNLHENHEEIKKWQDELNEKSRIDSELGTHDL